MIRFRAKAAAGLGAIAGALAVYNVWHHFTGPSDVQSEAMEAQPEISEESDSLSQAAIEAPSKYKVVLQWLLQLELVGLSALLCTPFVLSVLFSVWLRRYRIRYSDLLYWVDFLNSATWLGSYRFLAYWVALVVAMGLSAYGFVRRNNFLAIRIVAFSLLAVQFATLATGTVKVMLIGANPFIMLVATAFGLCGLGVVLAATAAVWLYDRPLFEPFAVGLMAVSLGVLCVPGLQVSTAALEYPEVNGAALLFASGQDNQGIRMDVATKPLAAFGVNSGVAPQVGVHTPETFTIKNLGNQACHWALLVMGDALLQSDRSASFTHTSGSVYNNVSVTSVSLPPPADQYDIYLTLESAELFSGVLQPGATASVAGRAATSFIYTTIDRAAISLPYYGEGNLSMVDRQVKKSILKAMHMAPPNFRKASYFTVHVDGGQLSSFQSLTDSSPRQPSGAGNSTSPDWTSHKSIAATYAITDQSQLDANSNLLFVFAVLLAAAVAGLLTSLQILIHILSKRKQPGSSASDS